MSRALIAGAILGAGLVTGGLLIESAASREATAAQGSPRLLENVMARVGHDFIDTLSVDEMYRRAASGLVKELNDPYSVLLTAEHNRRLQEQASAHYAGVGVELDFRDGFITVIAPLAGTPADSAGIKPGDRIIAINRRPTRTLTMDEVQQALRGAPGTKVTLSIDRVVERPTITLTRRDIVIHPVQHAEAANGIGYLELASFNEKAASEVRRAVDSLRSKGVHALILDVRSNPGGLLEQGVAVADLFLDSGRTIASTRGRNGYADNEYVDETPQLWPGLPIIALVDSGTASAGEIVAGALQDNERAILVGTATYGKGSAQSVFPLAGGRALKLTTARWFTPRGRVINRDSTKGGITPDVVVSPAQKPLAQAPTGGPPRRLLGVTQDSVLARAIQLLNGVKTPGELRARIPRH